MARYTETLRDQNLRAIPGALVSVTAQDGTTAVLTDDSAQHLDNPFLTDAYGIFTFNTAAGIYTIAFTYGGRTILKEVVSVGTLIANLAPDKANAGKFIALDADGNASYSSGTGADAGLRTDLSAPTGTSLLGVPGGGSLSGPTGASGVGFRRTDDPTAANLKFRTLSKVLSSAPIVLSEYASGPVELENAFDLLNKATGADLAYSGNTDALNREIIIDVPLVFPGENRSVFVRRGQTLKYSPKTGLMDLTALEPNTVPVFRLARNSAGTLDPGGIPVSIIGFRTNGGPGSQPIFSCANVTNPFFDWNYLSGPGIGIDLRDGADAIVANHYSDQGLVAILLGGQNHRIQMTTYVMNYDILLASNCFDCTIDLVSTYTKYGAIVAEAGTQNVKNLSVLRHVATMNVQYGTFRGYFVWDATDSDAMLANVLYRNCAGTAIDQTTGLNSRLRIQNATIDGLRTNVLPVIGYNQSTTAKALRLLSTNVEVDGFLFTNLPQNPVTLGGTDAASLRLANGRFSGNTSASGKEITVTSAASGSRVYMHNVEGDGVRPLLTPQAIVPVYAPDIVTGQTTLVAGTITIAEPLVRATTQVSVFRQTDGGTVGASYSVARTAGTGFTITAKDGAGATQAADTSVVNYRISLSGA